jgi:hypothetical protein
MNILQNLRLDGLSEECQFINLDLTERTWGSNEPVPCCKQCQSNECGYRCQRSVEKNNKAEWKELETDLKEEDRAFGSQEENVMLNADEGTHGLRDIKWILEKKNKELEEYLSVDGIPEDVIFEKKTIVGALASMVCELEEAEEQEAEISDILPVIESTQQPKLPKFKNNNERKAWLEDVEAWGLWYEDHNIEARYYKYDFPDGSRLIAVKYRYSCPPWLKHINGELDGTYKETYYQMIRSEKWRRLYYQKYYTHATESITALVDYLKEIQKGGTGSE